MKTELTLLERREIAKQTIPMGLDGWTKIIKNTHKKETYDEFDIPLYKEDVDEYFRTHPKMDLNTEYKEHKKRMKRELLKKFAEELFNNNIKTVESLKEFEIKVLDKAKELGFDIDELELDGEYLDIDVNGVESIYNGSKYIQAVYGWKCDEALLVYRFHWD